MGKRKNRSETEEVKRFVNEKLRTKVTVEKVYKIKIKK